MRAGLWSSATVRSAVAALVVVVGGAVAHAESAWRVCDRVAHLIPVAEQLRGLAARHPVRCRELTATHYGRRVRRLVESLNPTHLLEHDERILKILGIIPQEYPYASCMAQGQDNASWAFYDRRAREVVVRSDEETPDAILVHEIVHALQDQHFNLEKLHAAPRSSDRDMATAALTEGDAVEVEARVPAAATQSENSGGSGFTRGCEPPEGLFNSLMFVYEWGGRFLKALPDRDAAFTKPPCSARAILYPKEYLANATQHCRDISRDAPPGDGWRLLHNDVLGEFIVRNWMKSFVAPGTAILAGKGLKADRVELFRKRGAGDLVRWSAEFDSPSDAAQMMNALRAMIRARSTVLLDPRAVGWRVQAPDGAVFSAWQSEDRIRFSVLSPAS